MALTNFAALTTEELTLWSRRFWKVARNASFMNSPGMMGESPMAMIQRITELKKSDKGARAVITLIPDLEKDGVAGDRTLEGNEEAIKSYDQVIQLDQLRHANRSEGRMAEQRSVVTFRKESRDVLGYWIADRFDQMAFLTLSGVSYALHNNGAPRVDSDLINLAFASDVSAPTTNRHRRWDKTGGLVAGDTTAVAAEDTPTWAMLVEAKAYCEENYIRPIRGENGNQFYHVFMTPTGMAKLKQDEDYLANVRNAGPRGAMNDLFKGTDTVMVDGLAIHTHRHVYNTRGAASGSKWGAGSAINGQRVLMCGAQALGYGDIGMPTWEEKEFDYGNQPGISAGKICGFKKPKFMSNVTGTVEDFGVLVIDTAI